MNPSTESDRQHGRAEPGTASTAQRSEHATEAAKEWEQRKHDPAHHQRHSNGQEKSVPQRVLGFVEEHPVVAAAGAIAVGAAIAMALRSRSNYNRYDRRAARAARSMERTFNREMRALRNTDVSDTVGRFGEAIGDMLARIDLGPLAQRGKTYLDAARNRLHM